MNKKVLVFGGSGFLGVKLLKFLQIAGFHRITCLDLCDPKIEGVEFIRFNLIEDDIEVLGDIKNSLIINLTGQVSNPSNICFLLNSKGIDTLLKLTIASKSFLLQISTVGIFGTTDFAFENTEFNPETVYSTCKAFAEHRINNALCKEQFAIIRLSNLFGFDQEKGIMAYLKRSYLTNRELHFNNDGTMKRAYLHVDDCARILSETLMDKSITLTGSYNFVGKDLYTIEQLINLLEALSNVTFKTFFSDNKPYDNVMNLSGERWERLIGNNYNHTVSQYFKMFI